MTANHDLERRVADFYATEAPQRAPDRVLQQALATIDTTRQRRELSLVPRRFQKMNSYARLAVAAVLVLAVAALGLNMLPGSPVSSVGGDPSASTPPAVSPTPGASPTPQLTPAPLTSRYTSAVHGLSIAYPAGWTTVPATETDSTVDVDFLQPGNDFLYDPVLRDHLFLVLGSYALDGQAGEAWATAAMAADEDCVSVPESITVDGAPGIICGQVALTWVRDKAYSIRLYTSGDEPELRVAYDRPWFDDVLATVRLP